MIAAKLGKQTLQTGFIMGVGMSTRGAVELIVAKIALNSNLIDVNVYSAVIMMVFVTTVLSPIFFKTLVQKHYLKNFA